MHRFEETRRQLQPVFGRDDEQIRVQRFFFDDVFKRQVANVARVFYRIPVRVELGRRHILKKVDKVAETDQIRGILLFVLFELGPARQPLGFVLLVLAADAEFLTPRGAEATQRVTREQDFQRTCFRKNLENVRVRECSFSGVMILFFQ